MKNFIKIAVFVLMFGFVGFGGFGVIKTASAIDVIPPSCDILGVGGSVIDNGSVSGTATAEFHNGSDQPIVITFGSYKMYMPWTSDLHGPWLTTQTLHNFETLTVAPCSSVNFQIDVPECAYQIDLYKGGVLNWDVPFPEGYTQYYGQVFGDNFCSVPPPTTGTLIVKKVVVNDNGGTKTASDFSFQVNGGTAIPFEADGQNDLTKDAGSYIITEPAVTGYTTTYDNCSDVSIAAGGTATCTITNDDIAPNSSSPSSDLRMEKTVDKESASVGDTVTFTVKVTNDGPDSATGVTVSDVLPAGLTYVSDNSSGAYVSSTGVWTVGTLISGASATLTISVTVNSNEAGQNITNTASTNNIDDHNPENNSDSATVNIKTQSDVCSNIEGIQITIPGGMTESGGICTTITTFSRSSGGGGGGYYVPSDNSEVNGQVLGASTVADSIDDGIGGGGDSPQGEVLGESIGLPRTGDGGNATSNIIMLVTSGLASIFGLMYMIRKYRVV